MAALASLQKITGKIIPTSKGVLQNATTGIGADKVMRTIDSLFGSPVQKIFSFNLPIIGNVGPIDFLNYVGHAGGFKASKNGFIAVLSAKIVDGALKNIGPVSLPQAGRSSATSQTSATPASGASF